MTDNLKTRLPVEEAADRWSRERWPSAYDYAERDACKEAYIAGATRQAPAVPDDVQALAAKAWEHQHPSMKWRDAAPLFRNEYLATTKAILTALRTPPPIPSGIKALVEKLTASKVGFAYLPVNPDGPEAAQALIALQQEAAALYETIHEQKFALEDVMARVGRLDARNAALVEALEAIQRTSGPVGSESIALKRMRDQARAALTKDTPDDQ